MNPARLLIPLLLIAASANAELPMLKLAPTVTVSGLSSGGYMASQFHLAHADRVDGVGIVAAGPWGCAGGDLGQALRACVDKTDQPIDLNALDQRARQLAQTGAIAGLEHLAKDKVWLLHGQLDTRVAAGVSDALFRQYQAWTEAAQLVYLNDQPFHHNLPTRDQGADCTKSESPWLGHCDYDAAGALLNHLLGPLNAPADKPKGVAQAFDQRALGGPGASTLAKQGYIYIPERCAAGEACRLHISFHGCQQNAEKIGTEYVDKAGFNQWADANGLVILYPQTVSSLFAPLNPQACWDWWGYTGDSYLTRDGAQINAVYTMMNQLMQREPTTGAD